MNEMFANDKEIYEFLIIGGMIERNHLYYRMFEDGNVWCCDKFGDRISERKPDLRRTNSWIKRLFNFGE